jgi:hypothetical protein
MNISRIQIGLAADMRYSQTNKSRHGTAFVSAAAAVLLAAIVSPCFAEEFISLDRILSKEQQAMLGITSMRPDQRELLRQTLLRLYTQGYQAAKRDNLVRATIPTTGSAIETQIDGDFEGWDGETIVKLMNGQIWKQTEYHYEYLYAFMPNVVVYRSSIGFKMKVDGASQAVGVERLR